MKEQTKSKYQNEKKQKHKTKVYIFTFYYIPPFSNNQIVHLSTSIWLLALIQQDPGINKRIWNKNSTNHQKNNQPLNQQKVEKERN